MRWSFRLVSLQRTEAYRGSTTFSVLGDMINNSATGNVDAKVSRDRLINSPANR
jgi:hypothetical protein